MSWLSGGKNPADAAMPYINQIPGQTSGYQQPFFDAGRNALNPLQEQYSHLLSDPGGMMNHIGESYQQSPGFKFALQQALGAAGNASAAGGMAGTPQDQFQQMQTATGLASQDYNNWMQHALGLYGSGLSGEEGMAGRGQQAGNSMADMIAQTLAQQAQYGFRGQQEQNSAHNSLLSGIGKLGGALLGGMPGAIGKLGGAALGGATGGPFGAFAGAMAS